MGVQPCLGRRPRPPPQCGDQCPLDPVRRGAGAMTRARHRTPVRLGAMLAALIITLLVPFVPRAGADEPVDVPWTNLLPPLPAGYEPTRENLCVEGQPACVDAVIQEMQRRMQP